MLLHDCGKPYSRTTDEKGIGHYRGHQAVSARLTAEVMEHLRFDRALSDRIIRLVDAHDVFLSTERKIMLRRLHQYGEADLRALFMIHLADRIATGTRNPDHARDHFHDLNASLDALLAEKPCFRLSDLQINGHDLTAIGLQGKEIGNMLNTLLARVMDGELPNEKEALLAAVLSHIM